MGVSELTRRSLLRAGAGALAGAALRPASGLAASVAPEHVAAIDLGTLRAAQTVALPPGVAVAGLQWQEPRAPSAVEMRAQHAGGVWGPWVSARGHGHGPDGVETREQTGEALWVGGARAIQVRSSLSLTRARVCLVLEAPAALAGGLARAAALGLAQPVLAAGPGQPPIIARTAWAKGIPPPRVAPVYGAVDLAFVHHTENPNGYSAGQVPALLRAIFLFHREFNGWNDIGYNFVLDRFGRIWEARAGGIDEAVVGAQAGGYNFVSTGVAVLGSYSGSRISAPARAALQRLLAWKLALHGTPSSGRATVRVSPAGAVYSKYPANARVSLRRISGHRDADSTDCPGDALYGELPAIGARVLRLAGDPVRATLALVPPAPTEPGQAPQLDAALVTLAGAPLAGVPVQLQTRTVARRGLEVVHATVAEGVTDAAGHWITPASFAVGAPASVWLRALYLGAAGTGAAVSPPITVAPVAAATAPSAAVPSA